MLISSLTLSNFTVYATSHTFDLSPVDSEHSLIVIEGHNGSGKTSILTGIRLALFGKRIMHDEAGSYSKFIASLMRDTSQETSITLVFKIYTLGIADTYSITRSWVFDEKKPKEQVIVYKNNKYDETLGSIWDDFIDSIIPASIANLFFFDGEKIAETATQEGISALLETGIQSLLGINILNQLEWDLTNLIKLKSAGSDNTELSEKLNGTLSEIEILLTEKNTLELDINNTTNAISSLKNNLKDIDKIFEKTGARLFHDRKSIEYKYTKQKESSEHAFQDLLTTASGVFPLSLVSHKLQKILNQAENEKKATINKEIESLIEERDKNILSIIKENKILYDAVLNFITEYSNKNKKTREEIEFFLKISEKTYTSISNIIKNLIDIKEESERKYATYISSIEKELELKRILETIPEENDIGKITIKRSEILSKIALLQDKINNLERKREQTIKSIIFREQEQNRFIRLIAEEEKNETIGGRTIRYAQKAIENVAILKQKILAHSRSKLENLMLESLRVLFRKQYFIKSLSIDHTSYHIIIKDFKDNKIDINRLSAGERQLIVISILWGLAKASGRPLPLIIDTPLGRLDSVHREHLLDYYFPCASHQTILLATDTEITTSDFNKIEQVISRKYTLEYNESTFSTQVLNQGY